jgi:hypothetical protein
MRKGVWVLQLLLALAFAGTGAMKLVTPREQMLANPMMGWAADFSGAQIRLIGAAEVAGAIGLVVPAATGVMPMLTPLASAALAVLMGGAVGVHIRRDEPFAGPLMLAVLAVAVAYWRVRLVAHPAATSPGTPAR